MCGGGRAGCRVSTLAGNARFALIVLITILPVSVRAAQQVTLAPFKTSGIYAVGEKAGWTVSLPSDAEKSAANYAYTIKRNNQDILKSDTLDLSSGKGNIEVSLDEPAMLFLELTPPADGDAK